MTSDRYDVPADAEVHECPFCSRPFADAELLRLHEGLDHPDHLGDDERATFERVYDEETDDLRRYQLIAIGAIVLLYFGLLVVYALI